jgi:hypothetical protein
MKALRPPILRQMKQPRFAGQADRGQGADRIAGQHAISNGSTPQEPSTMEFHIALTDASPRLEVVQDAMFDIDPSALVDLDMSGLVMRISSWVPVNDLVDVLQRIGWAIRQEQVVQLPSICCGGCSG